MGSKLVAAAFTFVSAHNERAREAGGRELETTEVALLALMAHTALDDDAEPVFWMTRSNICAQLGIRDTEAGRKRLQRALSALTAAGAIAPPERYVRGKTPRYKLIHQGGRLASPDYPQVWTPGIPLTPVRGMPSVQTVDAEHPPIMDAEHPPEEGRGTKEEGRAREPLDAAAGTLELLTPPTPSLPDLKPHCDQHPPGWSQPCYACGEARKAYQALHGKNSARRKPLSPYDCTRSRHKVITADGICVLCGARDVVDARSIGATA